MREVRPEHVLHCTPERFWSLYLDDVWQRQMLTEGLGFEAPEILERRETDSGLFRKMSARPKLVVSGAVARMISHTLGYTETGEYFEAEARFTLSHATNIFGDRLELGGHFRIEALGDDRCRRLGHLTIRSKVPVMGGLIEKSVEQNVHKGWDASAEFVNDYLRRHPA